MPKWIRDCKICNDGLVIRMHELKKLGHSDRECIKIMVDESHKAYPELTDEFTFDSIRSRWRRHGTGHDSHAAEKRRKEEMGRSGPPLLPEIATGSNEPIVKPKKKESHADELGPDSRVDPFTGLREDDISTLINHDWMKEVTAGTGTLVTIEKNINSIQPTFLLSHTIKVFRFYAKEVNRIADKLERRLNETTRDGVLVSNKK